MMDVNVEVQHTCMVLQELQDCEDEVVHVAEARGLGGERGLQGRAIHGQSYRLSINMGIASAASYRVCNPSLALIPLEVRTWRQSSDMNMDMDACHIHVCYMSYVHEKHIFVHVQKLLWWTE